jgi:hypothetical protein
MKTQNRFTDKELLTINKDSNAKGTFKLIRAELLLNDNLDTVHKSILEESKNIPTVHKFLTENTTKLGKDKTIFYRLGLLRALNKHEATLQNLIGEARQAEILAKKAAAAAKKAQK